MAREPIFEIAQRFQNKIENDTQYANRDKEAFRNQYRADKKLPSELSGFQLTDMENQFGIADHRQNDATNLATSKSTADLGLMTANEGVSTFAEEKSLRDKERAKKLAEFSRIAEKDSLTLDREIQALQSQIALEPDKLKADKLKLEADILASEIAIRQAPSQEEADALKLQRQKLEEKYAIDSSDAEQYLMDQERSAATAKVSGQLETLPIEQQAALANAKTAVAQAEASLSAAPDQAALTTAQLALDKAKADYANKSLGAQQAIETQNRKNEKEAVDAEAVSSREQRTVDSMKRKQEIENLQTQLAISTTLDKVIELNSQLELKEKEHALQENQELEELSQKEKKAIDADRKSKLLNEHLTTQITTSTNNNSIVDLTAQTTFNNLKAAIPEYDLMPKGPRYIALYDAADAQHVSPEALLKINADLAKNIPKEIEYVKYASDFFLLSSKPRTASVKAQLLAAGNKLVSLKSKIDVDLLKLAIEKNVIPEDGLPEGMMDHINSIGSPAALSNGDIVSKSPASSIDTTAPNPNETYDSASGPGSFAQDTVMSDPNTGQQPVTQDVMIPNPTDQDIASVPAQFRELLTEQPKNGNNEEIVSKLQAAMLSPDISNSDILTLTIMLDRIEALRGK